MMLALGLAAAALAAEHSTAGATLGAFALQGPGRHTIHPALGAWVSYTPRPWSVTGELVFTGHRHQNDFWTSATALGRVSAVGGLALGTRPATVHLGAGPALSLTRGSTRWGEEQSAVLQLAPGLRVRLGLDGPLGERLAWQGHVGLCSRGLQAWDYDAALGLGVQW